MNDEDLLDSVPNTIPEDQRFFGGQDKALKTVAALPHKTFKGMVDQLLNVAIPLNMTRAEYHLMSKEERSQRKRVPYLVPCCFTKAISRRHSDFATVFNLICLDIDVDEKTGECPAAPYVNAPWTLVEQLMPFNFAVYHTASSTTKQPRIRIMVEASGLPVAKYKAAVRYVARMIGLVDVTKESFVCVQPMYLPTIFKGESEDEIHPLIIHVTDGRAVKAKDIDTVSLTHGTGESGTGKNTTGKVEEYTTGDVLDFLRPIVEDITLEHVTDALASIDPDLPYPDWLEVAAALRHQFPRDQAEAAYKVFDEWSSTGTKYASAGDTRAKWDSLRPNPVNRVPITIRTLFTKALLAGWDGNRAQERCFHSTRQWIAHQDRTATILMTQGVGRILATPMISQAGEEALLNMIVEECRKRFSMKISATALRKDLANMRLEMRDKNNKKKDVAPPWTKGLCYVAATDEFYRHATQEKFSPGALDRYYSSKLMPSDEQLKAAGQQGSIGAASRPMVKPQDYLLNSIAVPKVYDYVYDPRFPTDTFLHHANRPYVNLYTQNYPEPDRKTSRRCGEMLITHLCNLIEEEEYRQTLLDYMAYIVQFPGKKIRWAVLIQGVEGCGKTFLAEAMSAVLGNGHVRTVDNAAIGSAYNDWAYGAQLVNFEEIRVAGHNRHDVMNVLKPLITNQSININQRYRDSRQVDNTSNYMLFSNHHDALALTKGDRRYFVLKSRMQAKEQVIELGENYFVEMFNMLANSPGGLRHFLENWTISQRFDADGHAPRTKYMFEMLNDSSHEAALVIREGIEADEHPLLSPDLISLTYLRNWIEVEGQYHGKFLSQQFLSTLLREEGFIKCGRAQVDKKTHHIWCKIGSAASKSDTNKLVKERLAIYHAIDPDDWDMLEH